MWSISRFPHTEAPNEDVLQEARGGDRVMKPACLPSRCFPPLKVACMNNGRCEGKKCCWPQCHIIKKKKDFLYIKSKLPKHKRLEGRSRVCTPPVSYCRPDLGSFPQLIRRVPLVRKQLSASDCHGQSLNQSEQRFINPCSQRSINSFLSSR